ncbi:MAG: aldehyde dehydrogenase family protein [Oscillospiraceae bacterium]
MQTKDTPIYDKDLLSVQEVRSLVKNSKLAQENLSLMSQKQVDNIVRNIAQRGVENSEKLAQMAFDETKFGIKDDKIIKNIFASSGVYEYIKDLKTIGIISENKDLKTKDIAVPVGVVAGIVPSTNPTSTVLYKAIISIKSGNSIVFSPHPNAKNCTIEAVNIVRQAIVETGGDADLVTCISIPTVQGVDALMKHTDVSMILATGGSAMVKAAYSSGTPAIGVGPGNGPAFIEKSADVKLAVKRILDSKTFDNGTICASEQSVICEESMKDTIIDEMKKQGAYFLNDQEKDILGKFILRANGTMNPQIVGKDVQTISNLSGINVPVNTRVIVAFEDGIGKGHPYSNEKLAPILGFYVEKDYKDVCEKSNEILMYEGAGHTFAIHSENEDIINYFAKKIVVSRFWLIHHLL